MAAEVFMVLAIILLDLAMIGWTAGKAGVAGLRQYRVRAMFVLGFAELQLLASASFAVVPASQAAAIGVGLATLFALVSAVVDGGIEPIRAEELRAQEHMSNT